MNENQRISGKYGFYALSIFVLIVVGILGAMSLRDGFSGDQALFLIFSKSINNGAVLYRDVWDIKQPAIFVFYLIGGKLFGFNEVGIHLLELIYWLGLSLILIFGLRRYFKNPLFALLTPLFTIGIYYSVSGSLHYTQAEALVCFPLFMCMWFCQKFLENPDKKSLIFLSGLCGGIVLTFKLLFIFILAAFWLFFLLYYKNEAKKIFVIGSWILMGLAIPIALVILYFAFNNALYDLWYVTFVYPSNAVILITKMEDRTGYLINGLVWFFKSYFPVITLTIFLILLKLGSLFKNGRRDNFFEFRSENFIFSSLFIWAIIGFAVILMQRLSWWEYHYSLLMLPLGILAVKCIEEIFEVVTDIFKFRRKLIVYAALTILIMPFFIPTARRLFDRIKQFRNVELVKVGNREIRVTGAAAGDYISISADTAFLAKENPKAKIFIVSNPLYYYLSDTPPSFSSNGAMSDMFTPYEWKKLDREMSEQLPKYIFIEPRFLQMAQEEDTRLINTLKTNYSIYSKGERGSFYKLNDIVD